MVMEEEGSNIRNKKERGRERDKLSGTRNAYRIPLTETWLPLSFSQQIIFTLNLTNNKIHPSIGAIVPRPQKPSSVVVMVIVAWFLAGVNTWPGTLAFSRLDNLRQHAQTVHADKQEANERMMRELSSLHATMAAANKASQHRGKRGAQQPPPVSVSLSTESISDPSADPSTPHHHLHQQPQSVAPGPNSAGPGHIKQEDMQPPLSLVSQRPGTSTGYEGDTDILYHPQHSSATSRTWYVQDQDRSHSRQATNHSFRDPGQSFRAPSAASPSSPASSTAPSAATPSSSPSTHQPRPGQSFLASGESFVELGVADLQSSSAWPSNRVSNSDIRPSSSSSRPPTASRESADSYARSLPPLSAIVSSSLPPSQWGPVPAQSVFPIPSGPGIVPARPSTATRPGTAPASYYPSHPSLGGIGGGSGLVLSSTPTPTNSYGPSELARSSSGYGPAPDATDSSIGGGYDSPFSFHPPALSDQSVVSRKRPFSGIDDDDHERLGSSAGGSESRPQSRRLSVMELCNDIDADPSTRPFLPLSAFQGGTGSTSRPNTASTSLAALAIADAPASNEQQYRHQSPIRAGIQAAATGGGGSNAGLSSPCSSSGSGASTSPRGSSVASTSPGAASGRIYQQQQQHASVFSNAVLRHGGAASPSPPLRSISSVVTGGPGGTAAYASPGSSPGSSASAPRGYGAVEPRRERAEQVRLAVSSPHAASALGMRV
ncbi:hypothetical protein BGW80DRAFT_1449429 [Lactifluus volemus]|nr:hypothetical protein BGW80DRAFT_1449429 [Lactifluus volemus]